MKNDLMWSSKCMDWSTPQDFFDKLNEEFHFTLDPCADDLNHKCDKYYTEIQNGLMLLHARTDTRWFHEYIYKRAEVRFVKGRLKFGGQSKPAPFPSMVVIFRGKGVCG